MAKHINESNSNQILNKLGQNSSYSDSIHILNELKSQIQFVY